MTTLTSETSIGQLVAERPSRSRLFDRLGIDYCCGGRTRLDHACQEKGLDPHEVLRALETGDVEAGTDDRDDWADAPMGALADHIVDTHHKSLRRELPRLVDYAYQVAWVHGESHHELYDLCAVLVALKEELELHMLKEEMFLFPMIEQLEEESGLPGFHCGGINHPICVMEHEHDDVGVALARLRALTGGYVPPDDACTTYRALLAGLADLEADMHRHVHKENNILFPRARAAEAELRARAQRLRDE
jgi:regulator of cell morphogenesis and NO signaling